MDSHLLPAVEAAKNASSTFMPHGFCYLWNPSLIWINAVSDLLIFLCYVFISVLLTVLVVTIKEIPFQRIYLAFGAFIVACGFGHLMELLDIWEPHYWTTATVKTITAVASVGTAVALPFLIPAIKSIARGATLAQTKLALRDSERKYRQLLDTANEGICLVSATGVIEYVNVKLLDMLGYTLEEAVGRSYELFTKAQIGQIAKTSPREANFGERSQFDTNCIKKDGTLLGVLIAVSPVFDDNGKMTGVLGMITDITERRKAEEERANALAFMDSVVENLPNMLFVKDSKDLRFITFNKAGEQLLGIPREEILGKTDHDFTPKDLADSYSERDREVLAGNKVVEMEEFVATRHQGERVVRTKKISLPGPDGNSRYLLGISVDITDLKRTEQDLIEARELAIAGAKVKSEFLANMSHEIRTPLNGIIGLTDLLIDSGLSPEQEKFARTVQKSGDSLLNIINDILDFSKIEAGKMDLSFTDFSVKSLLESSFEVFQIRILEKNLSLAFTIDPRVPNFLQGDSARLGQILLNLVGNAVKFTEEGTVQVDVECDSDPNSDTVALRFTVTDNGIGLTPEEQARLFRPFTQADGSTARSYGGTGLGLSICKRLIDLMGGQIGVDSEKGRGASFWFTVNLRRSDENIDAEPIQAFLDLQPPPLELTMEEKNTLKILVAEDNSTNQMLVLAILKNAGFHAKAVANGKAVLDELKVNHYDMILMDCQMPVMDGYEATVAVRETEKVTGKRIPILALTANAMKSDEEACLAHGMDDFLTKPIKRDILLKAITKWAPGPGPTVVAL